MVIKSIYEIARFPFPWDSIISFGFILAFVGAVDNELKNYKKTRKKRYMMLILLWSLLSLFSLSFFIWSITYGGSEDYVYAQEYYKGNYEIAEGEVKNFIEENNGGGTIYRYFSVDSVKFEQRVMSLVDEFRKDNRKISHNGQKVRISYIPYEPEEWESSGQGKIVKIEMFIEE